MSILTDEIDFDVIYSSLTFQYNYRNTWTAVVRCSNVLAIKLAQQKFFQNCELVLRQTQNKPGRR